MKDILIQLLKLILSAISPELRKWICEAMEDLEKKAATTPNPVDDILVAVLRKLLGC